MTDDELDILPRELEAVFYRLQNRITDDIIRRMRANMGEITRAADWQIYRAAELGASKKELRRIIADTLKLADAEVDRIFDEAKRSGYARAADIYEKTGVDVRSYADNDVLKQLVSSLKAQTLDELQNITGTMGVATANRGKRQILSLTEFYTRTLDDAALDIASGAFDYNAVLKRAVRELTNSGIRHIYYDSVSKRPITARIEVAARRAIMTGVSQLTGKISEQNAEALGTDMYEVTAHEGCRETHLDWQGKWYSMADLVRICGYGDVAGLKGANCRHDFYPVIPGIDEPTYTAEELARIREDELTPREYNGKEYTKYQATQRQRELERTMRARRASIKALEDGGADEDDIILERASYCALSQEYTRFSKAMRLREQRERVTIDGLGNVGVGKWKKSKNDIDKLSKSGIMESRSDSLTSFTHLGKLDTSVLEKEFGKLHTDEIIIMDERRDHIKDHHPEDYALFDKYGTLTVTYPDLILKDEKNAGTVFMIKHMFESNLNVIIRVALQSDPEEYKNSVMTFYRVRDKNLNKLKKKYKTLYKRE